MVREWGRPGGWEELHSSHVITLNQPVTQVVTQKSQPSHNLSQHFSSYLCSTKNMIWSRSINPKTDTGVGDLGQNFFHPKFTRLGCFLSFASLFSFNVTLSIPSGCPVSDNDCRSDSDGAFSSFDFSRHSETHHHFHWAPQRMRCAIFTSWLWRCDILKTCIPPFYQAGLGIQPPLCTHSPVRKYFYTAAKWHFRELGGATFYTRRVTLQYLLLVNKSKLHILVSCHVIYIVYQFC